VRACSSSNYVVRTTQAAGDIGFNPGPQTVTENKALRSPAPNRKQRKDIRDVTVCTRCQVHLDRLPASHSGNQI
jgi:hypothetical protein